MGEGAVERGRGGKKHYTCQNASQLSQKCLMPGIIANLLCFAENVIRTKHVCLYVHKYDRHASGRT